MIKKGGLSRKMEGGEGSEVLATQKGATGWLQSIKLVICGLGGE